jgi:hypothetical protein
MEDFLFITNQELKINLTTKILFVLKNYSKLLAPREDTDTTAATYACTILIP